MTGRTTSTELSDDIARQGNALGIDAAAMYAQAAAAEPVRPADLAIWACNWPSLEVFLALQTKWDLVPAIVMGPMGAAMTTFVYRGIDYQAAEIVMRRRGHAGDDRLFADLQAMEVAALKILNERAAA